MSVADQWLHTGRLLMFKNRSKLLPHILSSVYSHLRLNVKWCKIFSIIECCLEFCTISFFCFVLSVPVYCKDVWLFQVDHFFFSDIFSKVKLSARLGYTAIKVYIIIYL